MQAVSSSVISLNCYSKGEQNVTKVVAYSFPGHERCTLSNLTFDELLAQCINGKLPCIIARVKDIEGKVRLFEGCAADTLGSFKLPGYFKVSLDAEWKACSYIQYYTLASSYVANQQLFHNFQLARTDTFFTLHGEMFLSGKKPDFASAKKYLDKALKENPKSERALELLGKLFFYGQGVPQNREKAKEYFCRVLAINPQNKFVLSRLAEPDLPAHMPAEVTANEPADVANQLEELSLEESSGTESEELQETTQETTQETRKHAKMSDFLPPSLSKTKEQQKETVVAQNGVEEVASVAAAPPAKKPPCSCAVL